MDVVIVILKLIAVCMPLVLATGVFYIVFRRQAPLLRARQQAIVALCAQRGLLPGASPGDFAILGRIDPRWLSNGFSSADHGVAVADFVRPAGKYTQFFTVLSFTVSGLDVPYVEVTSRDLMAGPVLGGPPAQEFESTEFDKRFKVKAKDRRSAVMLLDPGMMQLMLDCADVSFDMVGDRVLAFINRAAEPKHQLAEPVEFEKLFKFLDGFVPRVPELLRTEYAAARSESATAGVESDAQHLP